ncbi:MAG: hypothetical protein OEV42_08600 [Deltaproteobacteria bacterium]|nr:hypothetical protein [Deltaproteobacteria bacterium]
MNSKKYRIGWVVEAKWPYRNVMASTRIRCLDINKFLRSKGFDSDLYKSYKKYDVLIFQKAFSEDHFKIAQKMVNKGCKIILDINVNYFEKSGKTKQVTEKHIDDLHKFLTLTDVVLTSSEFLKTIAEKFHPKVSYIPEHISTIGNYLPKKISRPVKLLYCGYAVKAADVLFIEDVITELTKEHALEFFFVCEKDPHVRLPIETSFVKYDDKDLANTLRKGDIKVAPRKLDNSYDLGHSFTKIGYPMSVGLPVVASPVPSYKGSPALLAETREDWLRHVKTLLSNKEKYEKLSQDGIEFVNENYSLNKIGNMYINLFEDIF